MKSSVVLAILLLVVPLLAAGPAPPEKIPDITVKVNGPSNNSPALLTDGKFVEQESEWQGEGCVWWEGEGTYFVVDLGKLCLVEDLVLQADNNDTYQVDYSSDTKVYSNLVTVRDSYGKVGSGMDTFSTRQGDPGFVKELRFKPVKARYLKIYAASGDNLYSIAEVQVFGKGPVKP